MLSPNGREVVRMFARVSIFRVTLDERREPR